MIEEIEVFVKERLFRFKNKDYSQEDLEMMWDCLKTKIGSELFLSFTPKEDLIIKASSIDFVNKVMLEAD
ncbi:hypothetical protein G6W75_09995 [Staphylococcus sciuri]|uniref:hypothetical protein n=1 Tax=Mammaliicoccus sciuri TaxID=1296 RepID=UPI0013E9131A|nr:hypothetical protein [Mammaliicoccus sciuri]NGX76421.1 hypothetical protein [Mammaliicoccus sciuri]